MHSPMAQRTVDYLLDHDRDELEAICEEFLDGVILRINDRAKDAIFVNLVLDVSGQRVHLTLLVVSG